jgi:hypothetical protein
LLYSILILNAKIKSLKKKQCKVSISNEKKNYFKIMIRIKSLFVFILFIFRLFKLIIKTKKKKKKKKISYMIKVVSSSTAAKAPQQLSLNNQYLYLFK